MNIVVCIRQDLQGEISPFDACAYEAALRIKDADITLLSMGAPKTADFLTRLTRLGAKRAILLTDPAFAGADTLATAYALSLAVKKLEPQLLLCGRQTLVGDTGQVPPMLATLSGYGMICSALELEPSESEITCSLRGGEKKSIPYPALVTVERINTLRLPSIRSRAGTVELWSADDIGADKSRCGLVGSPTRVIKTFENSSGRRKCKFIKMSELEDVIKSSLEKTRVSEQATDTAHKLSKVFSVGEKPMAFASSVCENVSVLPSNADEIIKKIKDESPDAVLFASDSESKALAGRVAAMLSLGLCADCTQLSAEDGELIMFRPALSGSVIAKIKSLTKPAMASVRTEEDDIKDIIIGIGYGAADSLDKAKALSQKLGAELAASRKTVDSGILPYELQVGLTGKTVSPPVYIAIGISGAVHHIVGMGRSGTVIAINPDKSAPIFDYADYGILENF
ncbi:MAG: FAD-binding protein [Clostridia bacterium]|nr:FAD-binding protein [Clostridia bacterium]